MRIDEITEKLTALLEENTDTAGIIDSIMSIITEDEAKETETMSELNDKLIKLQADFDAVSKTNEKLLNKIMYNEEVKEEEHENNNFDITIDELFKED